MQYNVCDTVIVIISSGYCLLTLSRAAGLIINYDWFVPVFKVYCFTYTLDSSLARQMYVTEDNLIDNCSF